MPRLVYTVPVAPDCDWEENLYTQVVPVKGGVVDLPEGTDPLVIEALLYRSFALAPGPTVEAEPAPEPDGDEAADDWEDEAAGPRPRRQRSRAAQEE